MIKVFIIFLLCIDLFSKTIHFKESKYIEALGQSITKTGYIIYKKDSIETSYKNNDEILIFKDDTLFIKNEDKNTEIDLNRDIGKKIYFTILEAINTNDLSNLELYFEIKQQNNEVLLKPKDIIANYLQSIKYKKEEKLDYLHINMLNGDRISIEQID